MELLLDRTLRAPAYTEGILYVDGVQLCFTLEDADRRLEGGGTKVYGNTAIPLGHYDVVLDMSKRFGRIMPRLVGVPGFTGIRIHAGNTTADTEGCILVGVARGAGRLFNPRAAYERLMILLEDADARGEKITIEVR